jgi:hypothetical protein
MHHAMAKLFGGTLAMTPAAQTSNVAVIVRAALSQRDYVIGHRGRRQAPVRSAVSTQRFSSKASCALRYTATATEAARLGLANALA